MTARPVGPEAPCVHQQGLVSVTPGKFTFKMTPELWLEPQLRSLPPLVRALMVTDGTVTRILEAFFGERVCVDLVHQQIHMQNRPISWLDLTPGNSCLDRKIRLRGAQSDQVYVEAHSWLRLDRLPQHLARQMLSGKAGIGALLNESGLESQREVLGIYLEPDCPPTQAARLYRIHVHGLPAILIQENFLLTSYA